MTKQEGPQQYYSYKEIAYLCRRSLGSIYVWIHRTKTPRVMQYNQRRSMRIALVAAPDVERLQYRILHGPNHGN